MYELCLAHYDLSLACYYNSSDSCASVIQSGLCPEKAAHCLRLARRVYGTASRLYLASIVN